MPKSAGKSGSKNNAYNVKEKHNHNYNRISSPANNCDVALPCSLSNVHRQCMRQGATTGDLSNSELTNMINPIPPTDSETEEQSPWERVPMPYVSILNIFLRITAFLLVRGVTLVLPVRNLLILTRKFGSLLQILQPTGYGSLALAF